MGVRECVRVCVRVRGSGSESVRESVCESVRESVCVYEKVIQRVRVCVCVCVCVCVRAILLPHTVLVSYLKVSLHVPQNFLFVCLKNDLKH